MEVYRFTEASVSHVGRGIGNQDASRVEHHGQHCLAFLADGMGSARLGAMAAEIAVDVGLDMAKRAFVPQLEIDDESGRCAVGAAFSSAYNAIQRAAEDERDLNSLLTTFMAVYYNERTGCLHFGYCGDGGLVTLGDDGRVRLAATPHKGQTAFQTTSLLDFPSWTFGTVERVRAWVMLTDGLFDALCPQGALPVGDRREEALMGLFEATRHMDDPRMRPYLDASFSPSEPSPDDFGELFDAVADDRSIVVVRGSDAAFSERVAGSAFAARDDAGAKPSPDDFGELFDAVADDRSIVVVRGSDAAFSERVAGSAFAARDDAGASATRVMTPAFEGPLPEAAGAFAADGLPCDGGPLLETLPPEEAGRVLTVIEARKSARCRARRFPRAKGTGYAYV